MSCRGNTASLVAGLTIAVYCAHLAACHRPEPVAATIQGASDLAPVQASAATPSFPGVWVGGAALTLTAPFDGRVKAILVQAGAHVREHASLVLIEAKESSRTLTKAAEAAYEAAVADRDKANHQLREIEAEVRRHEQLGNLVPEQQVHIFRIRAQAAVEAVRSLTSVAAQRRLEWQARVTEEQSAAIQAPRGGTVLAVYVEPGQAVSVGANVARLLMSEPKPLVRFACPPEQRLPHIGDSVVITSTDHRAVGTVTFVSPELDDASGMVLAEAHVNLPTPDAVPVGTRVSVDLLPRGQSASQ
jgi:biotin carboxyl carrier protein